MKVKVYYNNCSDIEENNLKKLIEDLLSASKMSHFNLKEDKKDIEVLNMKLNRANNNLHDIILTENDFVNFLYLTIISSEEVQGMIVNELISEENIELAELKCVKTLEKLKNMAKEIIDKNLGKEVKTIWLCKQIDECNSVGDLYRTLNEWYNSISLVSKKQAVNVLSYYCLYMQNLYFLSEERLNKYSKIKSLFKQILTRINKKEQIDLDLIYEILKLNIAIDVDIAKTLNKNVIDKYNSEIVDLKIKQEKKMSQTLKLKEEDLNRKLALDVSFKETKIELTEEDKVCLQLYLEIVTDLSNGKIKIEDFENKTANYISYVEGIHYKEILDELIIKIQNSTDISKNIKTKGIKAINALKRTI